MSRPGMRPDCGAGSALERGGRICGGNSGAPGSRKSGDTEGIGAWKIKKHGILS
jgi:hypothetical protein